MDENGWILMKTQTGVFLRGTWEALVAYGFRDDMTWFEGKATERLEAKHQSQELDIEGGSGDSIWEKVSCGIWWRNYGISRKMWDLLKGIYVLRFGQALCVAECDP